MYTLKIIIYSMIVVLSLVRAIESEDKRSGYWIGFTGWLVALLEIVV